MFKMLYFFNIFLSFFFKWQCYYSNKQLTFSIIAEGIKIETKILISLLKF